MKYFLIFLNSNRQVQYAGDFCQDKNVGYFVAFGSIFATLSAVAIIQLVSETFSNAMQVFCILKNLYTI